MRHLALLAIFLALPLAAWADQTNTLRPTQDHCSHPTFSCPQTAVCYGSDCTCTSDQGGDCEELSIAAAPNDTYAATCYVYFHGGGGTGGQREDNDNWHFIQDVADVEDITSYTIDYKLMDSTTGNNCPTQMDDAISAANYIYTNYGCRYMMVGGHSWGGIIGLNLLWNSHPADCGGSAVLDSHITLLGGFFTAPVAERSVMADDGTADPCDACNLTQAGCIVDRWTDCCDSHSGVITHGNPINELDSSDKPIWSTTCSNDTVAKTQASHDIAAAQPSVVTHQILCRNTGDSGTGWTCAGASPVYASCDHNYPHSCNSGDWDRTHVGCDATWTQTTSAVTALLATIPTGGTAGPAGTGVSCNGCAIQ